MKSLSKFNIVILFLSTCIALTACNSGDSNQQPITPPVTYQKTLLYSFTGRTTDGANPQAGLIQASDGNFYGTTQTGGANNFGTVFKITPAGVKTILYRFAGGRKDGANPQSALIQASDGNFYGTTQNGGTTNYGTVFRITPAGVETILYSFAGGTTDGANPQAGLIQGSDGNLYGTTQYGGANTYGTVFRITPAGVYKSLYSFAGGTTDGAYPRAGFIQASDGNFYGTTQLGGSNNYGTVFKITPAGVETILYKFTGGTADGANPQAGLIQASDGNFYGTTQDGGVNGYGTIFEITPAGVETIVYKFTGGTADGANPQIGLIQAGDGNFYGTTQTGGINEYGTVFKITLAGVETILYKFTGGTADGANPNGLIQGSDGNFYGTTQYGGATNYGTVFKISTNPPTTPSPTPPTPPVTYQETVLYSFASGTADGANPIAGLIQASDGNFYGTTQYGGATNSGTVFKITPAGVKTILYTFAGGRKDGANPIAGLIQASDGNFYGTTQYGDAKNYGTVFKITPAGEETILYNFAGPPADGANSIAGLIQARDGNFYGTTQYGGATNYGTIFKITPARVKTILYQFAAGTADGTLPQAGLIQDSDGNLYGTTQTGGATNYGTVFKITPSGGYTSLYSFVGGTTDGGNPRAALIQGSDGNFYGTTQTGGAKNYGTIFKITPAGVETILYKFAGGYSDGAYPQARLIQGSDGNFYGTTQDGGVNKYGTVFKITPTGVETILYKFTGAPDGANPNGLIQGSDGNFYGTTQTGGTGIGYGTVFKISIK